MEMTLTCCCLNHIARIAVYYKNILNNFRCPAKICSVGIIWNLGPRAKVPGVWGRVEVYSGGFELEATIGRWMSDFHSCLGCTTTLRAWWYRLWEESRFNVFYR